MKVSSKLREVIGRARAAVETKNRIQSAIDTAIVLLPAAEARLQVALEDLGAAEAEAALSGESPASGSERDILNDARLTVDVLAARISGLQRKLDGHRVELQAVADELEGRREEFNLAALAEYQTQLSEAGAAFSAVLKRGAALADALGCPQMEASIRGIAVQNPVTTGEFLIDLNVRQRVDHAWVAVPVWSTDHAAEATYRANLEPLATATELKRALREAE